jgi:hypothetical protein
MEKYIYNVVLTIDEGYERDEKVFIGSFTTKKRAEKCINENIKTYHYSCNIEKDDYKILKTIINKILD